MITIHDVKLTTGLYDRIREIGDQEGRGGTYETVSGDYRRS